jgi:hypothetical protein
VPVLVRRLETGTWYEVWEAIVDLGFHGPAAGEAVTAILNAPHHDRWDEFFDAGHLDYDHPLENAKCRAFAAIGPAALEAVPWIAEHACFHRDAYDALRTLKADPLIVLENLNTDETHEVLQAVAVVRDLDPTGTATLIHAIRNHTGRIRYCSAEVLGEMGAAAADALPALREVLRTNADWDRELAEPYFTRAIQRIEAALEAGDDGPSG